jgi:hypothetical protein
MVSGLDLCGEDGFEPKCVFTGVPTTTRNFN